MHDGVHESRFLHEIIQDYFVHTLTLNKRGENMNKQVINNIAILSRVSTSSQSNDSAIKELKLLAEKNNWNIVYRYIETISGTKGLDERSELSRMLLDAKRKKFDCLCIWELSRLCRSMNHLVQIVQELEDCGVLLFSYREGISTDTHSGRMFMINVERLTEIQFLYLQLTLIK